MQFHDTLVLLLPGKIIIPLKKINVVCAASSIDNGSIKTIFKLDPKVSRRDGTCN